jgi:hypothetical protein
MKRLAEMNRNELLDMTDQQREELTDLECAYEGIPLLPEKPKEVEINYPERDVTIFVVDGHNFTDEDEALEYCTFVNNLTSLVKVDYDWGLGSGDFKYVGRQESPKRELEKRDVYSHDAYLELKAELKRTKTQEEVYNTKVHEYKDALEKRTKVYDKIDSAVHDVWEEKHREEGLVKAYQKYLSLTEDEDIAIKLLKDAYDITAIEEAKVPSLCN